jgi:hypothetical protein
MTGPQSADPVAAGLAQVAALRITLIGIGHTARPLAALAALAEPGPPDPVRQAAATVLAHWHLRDPAATDRTLDWLALAERLTPRGDLDTRARLAVAGVLARAQAGDRAGATEAVHQAGLAGLATPDLLLAATGTGTGPDDRLAWINLTLARWGLAGVALTGPGDMPFDRLASASPLPPVTEGPLVSVLLAAHDAGGMIGTALRSLSDQTWTRLEIIVIDDASGDDTAARVMALAAEDPRIRLIRQGLNGGAYVARNAGLAAARGEFVTLQDADDWSHPARIATQMQALRAAPGQMANLSQQARVGPDLVARRLRSNSGFIAPNLSSLMFRRAPVMDALGGWDTVRFGADDEFLHRLRGTFGDTAVASLPTGPLALVRDRPGSATGTAVSGIDHVLYGARREYNNAFRHALAKGGVTRAGDRRTAPMAPFPVPRPMLPDPGLIAPACDLVIAGDFTADPAAALTLIDRHRAQGARIGLWEVAPWAAPLTSVDTLPRAIRDRVDGDGIRVLVHGDVVTTGAIIRLTPPDPDEAGIRWQPQIRLRDGAS